MVTVVRRRTSPVSVIAPDVVETRKAPVMWASNQVSGFSGGLFKIRPGDERVWVGLDPSLTGYGMVAVNAVNEWQGWRLTTTAGKPLGWRVFDIQRFLEWKFQDLRLRRYEVGAICMELPSYGSVYGRESAGAVAAATALALIRAFGVADPRAYPYGVAGLSLKKAITGSGKAGGKDQITKELFRRYGIDAPNNDIADAAGLATVARMLELGSDLQFQVEVCATVRKNTEWTLLQNPPPSGSKPARRSRTLPAA